ncbi:MAG: phosphomannomutase/phosphoglucomutase [Myxococcales bacterium]|nr:phosphomannomutase/phosphoglucomutase [Myxococcales bacterium]
MIGRFPSSIFRAYDIRGVVDQAITTELAECLGLAYTHFLLERSPSRHLSTMKIAVGRDVRLSSVSHATALIRGLRRGGVQVLDLGVVPTPLTYFAVFADDLDGGLMVTGSHHPAHYNGFKLCVGKDSLCGPEIQQLRHHVETAAYHQAPAISGTYQHLDIQERYIEYLVSQFPSVYQPAHKRIVIDAANGTAGQIAPALFRRLGAEVMELYCDLDGRFPNHHPDPSVHTNLQDLSESVQRHQADLGIAFDGDADRLGVVDETGRILFGDELLAILSRALLEQHPGTKIISEVKASSRLYEDIRQHGGEPIMWKTGHSFIKKKMKESGALLAGEMSGHFFYADQYFGYDDAMYTAMRLYTILCRKQRPLSSLYADLPPSFVTPEIRVDCPDHRKFGLVQIVQDVMLQRGLTPTEMDGLRIDFPDGWGLIRASNTQPAIVYRFEAQSLARLREIFDLFAEMTSEATTRLALQGFSLPLFEQIPVTS